ncbi:3-hydroxyacyl-ACP dehydratase [Photorhabdus noenieputensis]|uniref:phosphotransferase n=1 Tax=Photorhabdus noenieputensis TaxID=1208607 RepID=UPI001BD4C7B9|nr:phosphotransferase [Photorhabdus noenieputensis]MBS9436207.1 3-hydroxyacyl-ACP dehydratase [Photorhabdus noenieputensis]MCK3669118.1 phosphotransferase [Photorhabdus noenieputensis]
MLQKNIQSYVSDASDNTTDHIENCARGSILELSRDIFSIKKHQGASAVRTETTQVKLLPRRHLYTYTEEARQKRLDYLAKHTGHTLEHVAHTHLDATKLTKTIEGFIGSIEIPVGIAGPLLIKGQYAQGIYYAPLATTEGALIASVSRGSSAITQSGGTTARVLGQRMIRAPRFEFHSVSHSIMFSDWIKEHISELRYEIGRHSKHAQLLEIKPHIIGRSVHLQFIYNTAAAAGQNMTTICTWYACQWIQQQLAKMAFIPLCHFMIDGNTSSDKKVSYQPFIEGRGTRVVAEVYLDAESCQQILRVTPQQLVTAYHHVSEGAIASGMIGININAANVIAGMFTALGQDIACVHESSVAHLHMTLTADNRVYCSITLPSLIVGTIGGGTNLPHQRECLNMLGCTDENGTARLAEIIASYCLALDISTLSAIAADEFAQSHEKLGRYRPVTTNNITAHTPQELDLSFFQQADFNPVLQGAHLTTIKPKFSGSDEHSMLTHLSSNYAERLIGLFPFSMTTSAQNNLPVMLKLKPLGSEVVNMILDIAKHCSPELFAVFQDFEHQLEFNQSHSRELAIMNQQDPRLMLYIPIIYGVIENEATGTYALIEELLHDMVLMNNINLETPWKQYHLEAAIRGVADIHSIWLGREEELTWKFPQMQIANADTVSQMKPLWQKLGNFVHQTFPELFTAEEEKDFQYWVDNAATWWKEIEQMPRTLIHGDFNPRNIAFRQQETELRLCAWDWELSTLHLPQRDLAELLAFSLDQQSDADKVAYYIELHRVELEQKSGLSLDPINWRRGYELALRDLWMRRIPLYMMAHNVVGYPFMERTMKTLRWLISLTRNK